MSDHPEARPARLTHPLTVFAGAFVLLLIYNVQTLDDPPYWDALLGIFLQSAWLADNGFDYLGLVNQPSFNAGGPNLDPFYILAPIYAGLYKLLPVAGVFIVAHLMNLAFAALAIALFYALLKPRLGAGLSLLWCAALALDPVWSGQCAAIYLEIPLAAAFLLAARSFDQERYRIAALWCFLGFLIKPSAMLLALAFVVYIPARWLLSKLFRAGEARASAPPRSVLWLAAALPPSFGLWSALNIPELSPVPAHQVFEHLARHTPQSLALVGLLLVASLAALVWRRARQGLLDRPRDLDLILLLCTLAFGFWLALFRHGNPLVRYAVPLLPPSLIALALLGARLVGPKWSALIPLLFALWGGLNQHGALLPIITPRLRRSGQHLERSREFLDDLEGNRELCRALSEKYRGATLVVKWPFAQMLAMPKLGYVDRAFDKVACLRPPANTRVMTLTTEVGNRPDALFIYAPNAFEIVRRPPFDPPPGARVVLVDAACRAYNVVYALPRRR